MPIAGPGSRAYAFVIDWHIRILLALAWLVAAWYMQFGSLRFIVEQGVPAPRLLLPVALMPAAIYFLYHPLLELLMRGQTPGKRMAGVRVVTLSGAAPGSRAVLIRNIFRLIDCLPVLYVVGLVTTLLSARQVRLGDMAAGTVLMVDEHAPPEDLEPVSATGAPAELDLATRDLVKELLARWPSLAVDKREAIARTLLERTLGRADHPVPLNNPDSLDDAALHARLTALSGRQ